MIYGARISPSQFLFWFFLHILQHVNLYCEIVDYFNYESQHLLPLITSITQTIFICGCLICHFFVEDLPEYHLAGKEKPLPDPKESPVENASFPSLLTFAWFTEFAWTGTVLQKVFTYILVFM